MNRVVELLKDYFSLTPSQLHAKWALRYDQVPQVSEVIDYLKQNQKLELMIDSDPFTQMNNAYLVRYETRFKVFTPYQGMEVNEVFFTDLEAAVTEKLNRTLSGLGRKMRGS